MRLLASLAVATVLGLVSTSHAGNSGSLPQYIFTPGERLTYSGHDLFKYEGGSLDDVSHLQITVLSQNPDGSFRILVRNGDKETQKMDNASGQPDQPERVTFYQLDMTPFGKVVSVSGDEMADAPPVLPRLAADAKEMSTSWKSEPRLPGQIDVYQSNGAPSAGNYTFHSSTKGTFKDIYGIVNDQTFHFDLDKGIVTTIDTTAQQTYGFKGSGTGAFKLDSEQTISGDQLATLIKDSAAYFAANDSASKQIEQLSKTPEDAPKIAADITASLATAEAGITDPDIKAQFDHLSSDLQENIHYAQQDAQRIAKIVNTAAPDFTGTDLDGKVHMLADYHGKVIVMDFWYRGCGWCLRAMPQMKQVVEDFKDKPVAFLGMNTDKDPADAKFVSDAMSLNYPTLRFTNDVASKFNVQGFPSLLVIDQTGTIRVFDEGYSPTLRADLDKKIQDVLNGSTTQPSASN